MRSTRCSRPISRAAIQRRAGQRSGSLRSHVANDAAAADGADDRRSSRSTRASSWAWYGGGWGAALAGQGPEAGADADFPSPAVQLFQFLAPGTAGARRAFARRRPRAAELHAKDIDAGHLPPVTFYKPQGNLNEHAGLCRRALRRRASRRSRRASGEKPAMAAHGRGHHL